MTLEAEKLPENRCDFRVSSPFKLPFPLTFFTTRSVYDGRTWEEKLSDHSWLLDLGVMLCEPAIRFEGMAGECLWGCACWVVVPYEQIRGPEELAEAAA